MIEKKRSSATLIAVFLISLLLLGGADAAPRLIACMSAHQDEMKALNTQIAELQKIRVTPGGPNTKLGDCAHRLETIRGNALPRTADKNSVEHREKISCLTVKRTLLEQKCICEAKGLQFSGDPAVIDSTLAAQKRFADAQKAARRGALRNSPEVRKIVDETSKARGCYSAQVIEIYNKSTAAVEKFGRAGP